MRSAASPLAELAAADLPAAAGGLSGGGASHHVKGGGTYGLCRLALKTLSFNHIAIYACCKWQQAQIVITLTFRQISDTAEHKKKIAPSLMLHKESPKHIASSLHHNFYNTLIFNKLNT